MSTSFMYHTQGIIGFQHCSFSFQETSKIEHIKLRPAQIKKLRKEVIDKIAQHKVVFSRGKSRQ